MPLKAGFDPSQLRDPRTGEWAAMPGVGDWLEGLTPSEHDALLSYKGSVDYASLNGWLRTGEVDADHMADRRTSLTLDEQRDALDTAIAKAELSEDVVAWRGLPKPMEMHVGDEITDQGYVSVTTSQYVAIGTAQTGQIVHEGTEALVEIRLPKGWNGAPLDSIENMREAELLLPRGSRFRVTHVGQITVQPDPDSDPKTYVHVVMEVI